MATEGTISLNRSKPEPSNSQMVGSLELFEQVFALREELEGTQAQLKEARAVADKSTSDMTALDNELKAAQSANTRLEKDLAATEAKRKAIHDTLNTTVAKHKKLQTDFDNKLKQQNTELKTLRALNPQKLNAKVKRLQNEKRSQTDTIAKLREDNAKLHRSNVDLQAVNQTLYQDNQKLDGTLEDAVQDLKEKRQVKPLIELEANWSIYGDTGSSDRLIIVDRTSNAQCVIHRTEGISETRKVPKFVVNAASRLFAQMTKVKAELIDYTKPLEEQEFSNV